MLLLSLQPNCPRLASQAKRCFVPPLASVPGYRWRATVRDTKRWLQPRPLLGFLAGGCADREPIPTRPSLCGFSPYTPSQRRSSCRQASGGVRQLRRAETSTAVYSRGLDLDPPCQETMSRHSHAQPQRERPPPAGRLRKLLAWRSRPLRSKKSKEKGSSKRCLCFIVSLSDRAGAQRR